jgi:hypothetical protein
MKRKKFGNVVILIVLVFACIVLFMINGELCASNSRLALFLYCCFVELIVVFQSMISNKSFISNNKIADLIFIASMFGGLLLARVNIEGIYAALYVFICYINGIAYNMKGNTKRRSKEWSKPVLIKAGVAVLIVTYINAKTNFLKGDYSIGACVLITLAAVITYFVLTDNLDNLVPKWIRLDDETVD